jgi:hypothetical protein
MTIDNAYKERNACIAGMAKMALMQGWNVGTRPHQPEDDNWEEDWRNVVMINLPTGQVSWHYHDSDEYLFSFLPPYQYQWDGHTTEEKYIRLVEFLALDTDDQQPAPESEKYQI